MHNPPRDSEGFVIIRHSKQLLLDKLVKLYGFVEATNIMENMYGVKVTQPDPCNYLV